MTVGTVALALATYCIIAGADDVVEGRSAAPLTEDELTAESLGTELRLGQKASLAEIQRGFLGSSTDWPYISSYVPSTNDTSVFFTSPFNTFTLGASLNHEENLVAIFADVQTRVDGKRVTP